MALNVEDHAKAVATVEERIEPKIGFELPCIHAVICH